MWRRPARDLAGEDVKVEPAEMAQVVEPLPPAQLAVATEAIVESYRHLADAQLAAHHQLEADLVADGPQGREVGQAPAVDGKKPAIRS